jgi:hypothetical protein
MGKVIGEHSEDQFSNFLEIAERNLSKVDKFLVVGTTEMSHQLAYEALKNPHNLFIERVVAKTEEGVKKFDLVLPDPYVSIGRIKEVLSEKFEVPTEKLTLVWQNHMPLMDEFDLMHHYSMAGKKTNTIQCVFNKDERKGTSLKSYGSLRSPQLLKKVKSKAPASLT